MTITVTTGLPIPVASTAASFTYSTLIAYLDTWLARNDVTVQAAYFLSMLEDYLNYGGGDIDPPLRCREMEAASSITPDATAYTVAIPTDYLEYRSVVELASIRRPLQYITADQAEQLFPVRTGGGLASHFYIAGEFIYPLPRTTNVIELTYYQKIPSLTSTNTTNWLLDNNASIYLRGTLMMAADFIKDNEEYAKHASFVRGLVAGMNRSDVLARYSRAGVSLRGSTP